MSPLVLFLRYTLKPLEKAMNTFCNWIRKWTVLLFSNNTTHKLESFGWVLLHGFAAVVALFQLPFVLSFKSTRESPLRRLATILWIKQITSKTRRIENEAKEYWTPWLKIHHFTLNFVSNFPHRQSTCSKITAYKSASLFPCQARPIFQYISFLFYCRVLLHEIFWLFTFRREK